MKKNTVQKKSKTMGAAYDLAKKTMLACVVDKAFHKRVTKARGEKSLREFVVEALEARMKRRA